MKKKLTFALTSAVCLLAAVAFIACQDTDYVYVSKAMVGLTPSTDIAFTSRGGERTIAVRTNQQQWSVSSDQEWCQVTPSENDSFVVSVAPNHTVESLPEATVMVFTSVGQREDNFATMSFKVSQAGFELMDLSAEGRANCYVISEEGYYKFDARMQGKSELATVSDLASCSADWVWATQEGLVSVEPKVGSDGYISFVCSDFKPGNAVVALLKNGSVVWSWHIWLTDQALEARERNMMCVNLGATSDRSGDVSQFGLLYQWGRKDPFIASSGVGNYPTDIISYNEQTPFAAGNEDGVRYTAASVVNTPLVASWGVSDAADAHTHSAAAAAGTTFFFATKAMPNYSGVWTGESDPCPPGWRLPTMIDLGGYFSTAYSTISWSEYQGVIRGKDRIPAQGYRDFATGRIRNIGRSGWIWSSETNPNDLMVGFNFAIGFEEIGYARTNIKINYGFGVRCAKE